MRERFWVMMLPQLALGGLAAVVGILVGLDLFPARAPSATAWLLGAAFLACVVTLVRPHWRRTIEEPGPAWRLFTPTNAAEKRMWIALSLAAGVCEELVWRGVLPSLTAALTGSVPAAIAISVFSFAVAHAVQGLRSVLAIASIAASFHALVALSGSLYVAMAVHFVYDVIAGFTYAEFARATGKLEPPAIFPRAESSDEEKPPSSTSTGDNETEA
jgi:membrane protease YdiL (CAAX protease family)